MSKSESNTSNDGDEKRIERAKGVFDGAESIDEMISQLEEKQEELESLQSDGWELADEVVFDDYATLVHTDE